MTDKRHRVPTPPSQGAMEPIRLDTVRWYKKLREENPAVLGRVQQFSAGEILVHQGETIEGPMAYLVVEGILAEKQTNFTPEQGHVSITMFHVSPGSIAYGQALAPQFATQPSFTTIVAETDGEALLLDGDEIKNGLGKYAFLLNAQIRLQQQLLVSLWHQKLANEVDPKLQDFVQRRVTMNPNIETADDLVKEVEHWLHERGNMFRENIGLQDLVKKHDVEMKAVAVRISNQQAMYRKTVDQKQALENALKLSQMESNELRRLSPIAALDEERRLMTLRSLGTELYLDRVRKAWANAGLDPHALDFTEDESKLLTAEEPDGLAEIIQRVRRTNQWDDEEIDAALQLGISPNRSSFHPPKDEVDELMAFARATDADPAPPTVKARPHISTLGFEDVDMAAMRDKAAKPVVSPDGGVASFDLEGGLPRITPTPAPAPDAPKPYRVPTRTLDYSEDAAKAVRAIAASDADGPDVEFETVDADDVTPLDLDEDGDLFPASEPPTVPQPIAAVPRPVTKIALVKKPISIPRPAPRPLKK